MNVEELLQQADHAFRDELWETAWTYAGAVLAQEPSNIKALVIRQAAGLEQAALCHTASELLQGILAVNRMLRELDPR